MQFNKVRLNLVLWALLGLSGVQAQEAILTTGANASGSGVTVNYSIGQVVYTTNFGGTSSVAQGVQQAYEISVLTEITGYNQINLLISAYPNPTTDYLTLKIEASPTLTYLLMIYQLYNIDGKVMISGKIEGNETKIRMKSFEPGTYFLKINDKNVVIKTFKIIKF